MSRYLLDTHVLLWVLTGDDALGRRARRRFAEATSVAASAASLWELAIKHSVGKFPDPQPLLPAIERSGLTLLPILPAHALAVGSSPLRHRDPFDRLLVEQARIEARTLVTADERILATGLDATMDARE